MTALVDHHAQRDHIPRHAWVSLALVGVGLFLTSLDVTAVALALPEMGQDFHASRASLSLVVSVYNVVLASLLLVSGRLADRFGRKRMFLSGVAVFLAGSLASGVAGSMAHLVVARGIQATGGALMSPSALALVLPEFPVARRTTAVAVVQIMGTLAAALGPSFGAVLVDLFSWRSIFFINVPAASFVLIAGRRKLRNVEYGEFEKGFDVFGVPLGALAVGMLVIAVSHGRDWGWSAGSTTTCFVAAAVLAPGFVVWSRRHPRPLLDLTLFRVRTYAVSSVALVFQQIAFFGFFVLLPLFMTAVRGYSTLFTGVAIMANPLTATVVGLPAARLADRVGHRWIAASGCLIATTGLLWWSAFLDADSAYWTSFFPGAVLMGLGAGMSMSTLTGAAISDLEPSRFAVASATRATISQLAAAFGLALSVAILGEPGDNDPVTAYHRTYHILAVSLTVAALIAAIGLPSGTAAARRAALTHPD